MLPCLACEHKDRLSGRSQQSSCLAALRALEAAGHIELPPARQTRRQGVPAALAPMDLCVSRLTDLRALEIVAVEDDKTREVWRQVLHHEHPQGAGPFSWSPVALPDPL